MGTGTSVADAALRLREAREALAAAQAANMATEMLPLDPIARKRAIWASLARVQERKTERAHALRDLALAEAAEHLASGDSEAA